MSNTAEKPEVMTPFEVAEFLRVSIPTVMRLVRDGKLTMKKVGRQNRFKRAEVEAYFEGAA